MIKSTLRLILFCAVVFAVDVFAASAQTVTGSIGNGTFAPGKTVRATVVLGLPSGLHANSHSPGAEYAIPTTVSVSARGVRVGPVSYPRGRNRGFEFTQTPINVYEGRTTFSFNITVPPTFRGTSLRVNVTVKYQACTNEVCYPPKSKQITLTAKSQ
jgi:Disulphide bond corrector protein DsbC